MTPCREVVGDEEEEGEEEDVDEAMTGREARVCLAWYGFFRLYIEAHG